MALPDFTGQNPATTYKSWLHLNEYTNGITGTLGTVFDGAGNSSALSISSSSVKAANFTFNGQTINLSSGNYTLTYPSVAPANNQVLVSDGSGNLTWTTFTGLTDADYGDITVSATGTVMTIDPGVVTYSKIQNVSATDKVLGRSSVGAGSVEEIPFTSFARSLADDADAATARSTLGLGTIATQNTVDETQVTIDTSGYEVITGSTLNQGLSSIDAALLNDRATGLQYGGLITNNTTSVSVSAGHGSILDSSSPSTPVFNEVSWNAASGITGTNGVANYLYVDSTGTINVTTTAPTPSDFRTYIQLGWFTQFSGTITSVTSALTPLQQVSPQIYDVFTALGRMKTGLGLSAVSTTLTVQSSAGSIYAPGSNFHVNPLNPHAISISAENPKQFRLTTQTVFDPTLVSDLPVGFYDSAGTITAIPGSTNRATIFVAYQFASAGIIIQYGQQFYNSLDEAVAAVGTYAPVTPAFLTTEGIIITYIVATKGCTDLADPTTAQFITTNRFGGIGGGTTSSLAGFLIASNNLSDLTDASIARTNLGVAIGTNVQAFDTDLSALAGLATTGLIARTGSGTAATRTLTGPAAGITVTNGDGVSGNPTLALADDLAALEGMSGTGYVARTTANTYAQRTITGTANQITVTNGDGVAGNTSLTLPQDIATSSSPQFAAVNIGAATDTTITRTGAGDIAVEGNQIYRAGGTDVPVTDGGTGLSSATAYAVLTGGTTSTGAFQSVSGVGTSGQVLTSNGAGALPTWQASGGGGSSLPYIEYISGKYYIPTALSYNTVSNSAASSSTTNSNVVYYPIVINSSATFTKLAMRTGTSNATGTITAGIYASNGTNTQPTGSAITDSVVTFTLSSINTEVNVTFTNPVTLSAGLYWFAFQTSASSSQNWTAVNFLAGEGLLTLGYSDLSTFTAFTAGAILGYTQTNTYSAGSLPTVGTLSVIVGTTSTSPTLALALVAQ